MKIKKLRNKIFILLLFIIIFFIFFIVFFKNYSLNKNKDYISKNILNINNNKLDDSNYDVTFYKLDNNETDLEKITNYIYAIYNRVRLGHFVTIDGWQLEGGPQYYINATFSVDDVKVGKDAYNILKNKNANIPIPTNNMEYIIVTVSVIYNKGEPEYLKLFTYDSRMQMYNMDFWIKDAEPFTKYLYNDSKLFPDNFYVKKGTDEFPFYLQLKKGEKGKIYLAFLRNKNNNNQLMFQGFENRIGFDLNK